MKHLAVCVAVLIAGLMPATGTAADGFGMILEIRGEPSIRRGTATFAARFGDELLPGDLMQTDRDDVVIFVAYATCDEWTLPSMSETHILDTKKISSGKGGLTRSARLPACYNPESFAVAGPNVIGGTMLFSPPPKKAGRQDDSMEKLLQTADTGQASNSELMSLIVLSLRKGRMEQARVYSSQLLRRNPGAVLPAPLAEQLGTP